jgi:hypothetical protein
LNPHASRSPGRYFCASGELVVIVMLCALSPSISGRSPAAGAAAAAGSAGFASSRFWLPHAASASASATTQIDFARC